MHTDLSAFPPLVQDDLDRLTRFLVMEYDAAARSGTSKKQKRSRIRSIILHGDHGDADDRQDRHPDHYSLLVIVNRILPRFVWPVVQAEKAINNLPGLSTPVSLSFQSQTSVNEKIRDGYFLYRDISKTGTLLYQSGDKGLDLLSTPERPSAEDHYKLSQEHFGSVWPLACSFLSSAYRLAAEQQNEAAALYLHLSAEQAYRAFLLIHSLHVPRSRDLSDLREFSEAIHPELAHAWTEQKQAFHILKQSFTGTRFSSRFTVGTEELDRLFSCTDQLLRLIRYLCRKKLETLEEGSLDRPQIDQNTFIVDAAREDLPLRPLPVEASKDFIARSPELQKKLDRLFSSLFDLEDPCCQLMTISHVMKCLAWEGGDVEHDGISLMGDVTRERASLLKDKVYSIFDLIRELRVPDEELQNAKTNDSETKEDAEHSPYRSSRVA
ncbi:HEPN domain-containing protein [Emcibacter nanhaiensis]|uniref:HEPN domain-containing protein n=1 Tax=Emcibacter nanhaiensis TaxID=1505037 RepID=A0A501PEU8_9PROT|nr:HEPN domain-containing protein [Emcibacter nanhaiensis]TPD58969.1 HEPN domain-containing protein [Emcibacter nanhaiensis]